MYAFEGNLGALHHIQAESGLINKRVELAHVTELCPGDEMAWVAAIRGLWTCDANLDLHQVSTDRAPKYLHAADGHLTYAVRANGGTAVVLIRQDDGTEIARHVFQGARAALYPQVLAGNDVTVRPKHGIERWNLASENLRWSSLAGQATSAAVAVNAGLVVLGQPTGDATGHQTPVWLLDIDSGEVLDTCSLAGVFSNVQGWGDDAVVAGLTGLVRLAPSHDPGG